MNVKANLLILKSKSVKSLFVVPSASDESLPIGALWKANNDSLMPIKPLSNIYLGNAYENTIKDFVKKKYVSKKFRISKFSNYKSLNKVAAELLQKNNIIARCCGREEWGARSLGNRSILCNPSNIENIKKINKTIKSRDFWMPFSPTIIMEDKNLFFKHLKNCNLKYMTILADSTILAHKKLTAAIHPMDNTLRPQLLSESDNPSYYDLIYQFKKKTGVGALLNTSFNLHGEPNVSDYNDAINTVIKSDLNYLIIENFLLEKIK
jgi:carbamoyltransferase